MKYRNQNLKTMRKLVLGVLMTLMGLIVPVICIVKSIQFNQQCAGYLKQAADANTVELALERVNLALDYIERNNLTEGYTSVLWKTEDENVGYWYRNVKACQGELESCLDATPLEKSNVLMKVRESLTDNGEKGTSLTIPSGISRYPSNAAWGWARLFSYLLLLAGVILFIHVWSEEI